MPGRGSEYGAGWGLIHALQQFSDCTVITEPGSGTVLEEWTSAHPESTLKVEALSDPSWARYLRFHRIGEFIIYLAWQRKAKALAQRLVSTEHFDVAHHATLSPYWLPSIAVDLGIPSLWGPVGGAVTTPRSLRPLLGVRGYVSEALDWFAVRTMARLPSTHHTWIRATRAIVQNEATAECLPASVRDHAARFNHAMLHDVVLPDAIETVASDEYVAWVSPMESRKGPELVVRALARTRPDIHMVMAGDGPERARIETIAETLGVTDRITFVGQVPHDQALEIISGAAVSVFTGLREEGGLALTEAMILGTPLVVLGNGGAETIARSSVDRERVSVVDPAGLHETIAGVARAIEHQIDAGRSTANRPRTPLIDQEAAVEELSSLVTETAGLR